MTNRRLTQLTALTVVAILVVGFLNISGCYTDSDDSAAVKAAETYTDIPGITDEEIAALEALFAVQQSFSFGNLTSPDIFLHSDGTADGFTPLLCDLLSELFGVSFVSGVCEWDELINGINDLTIDFTNSINMPADMRCHFLHTSPVAGNKISVFTDTGNPGILSEYDLRGMNIGFYTGSYAQQIVRREFPDIDFTGVDVNNSDEMASMLGSGEIDAFICDTANVFAFYKYDNIVQAISFPGIYIPASITTANPQLQPLISVITKYLMTGGKEVVDLLYDEGEHAYASHAIWETLNDEERRYIDNLRTTGTKVPYGATATRYPVAFYDYDAKEYQGIAIDVLNEISKLTGIEFYLNCNENTTWRELEEMLKTGEIALLSQLIPNEARSEYAIWPDKPYFTARYALLSNIDYPFLSIDQVPYATVGFAGGTAEQAKYLSWFPDAANYKTYPLTDDGLDALENGEIDLFFSLDYTMLYESNYRENPNQKINIIFNDPVEPVPFGLNKDEEILCSIISKAQNIINLDKISRNWTSRLFDLSAQIATERLNNLTLFLAIVLVILAALFLMFLRTRKLKRESEQQTLSVLEAHHSLQTLLDMAPVGIIITRCGDGQMLYANRAGLDVFNCESLDNDVKNKKSYDFMPETQPDGRASIDAIADLWQHDEGIEELYFRKITGEVFVARVAYCHITYHGQDASLNVVEDMTAEREYQQALENIAEEELEANQLKSRFLATMSHEIRTPMNAILGIAEILLQNGGLPTDTEEAVGQIYESGYLLLGIINDILDLSKLEAGKLEIFPLEYDFPELINETVNLNRLRYSNKPINFHLAIDANTPVSMIGDELRIKQILNNILTNAYKYTDKGDIRLAVSAVPLSFADTLENDVALIFRISDTGQGMTAKQLSVLFDDYTRFNKEANRTTEGVGLGMSITKHLVELMNGEITVTSEPDKGTEFTVTIPQKRVGERVCGENISENPDYFDTNTSVAAGINRIAFEHMPYGSVLIVDDVRSNIYVTKGMLLPYELQIDTASSGFEAIEKVEAGNSYDIIFMDHMMPKMSGIETTQILRDKGYKGCIIALTANALVGQDEVFIESGFDGYISKPIDSRELNHALNEFIRNKKRKHT